MLGKMVSLMLTELGRISCFYMFVSAQFTDSPKQPSTSVFLNPWSEEPFVKSEPEASKPTRRSCRVVASVRASRTESLIADEARCSLQLPVPLGRAQRKPILPKPVSGNGQRKPVPWKPVVVREVIIHDVVIHEVRVAAS